MQLKIQWPQSNVTHPVLIYNEDRSILFQMSRDEWRLCLVRMFREDLFGKPKIYVEANLKQIGGIELTITKILETESW